jgi:hypothetical protein
LYVVGVAFTCVAENPVMLANGALVALSPHACADEIILTLFVAARLTPESVSKHGDVRVHCVKAVRGPFIVNAPTKYEKSAKPAGSCDQHKE